MTEREKKKLFLDKKEKYCLNCRYREWSERPRGQRDPCGGCVDYYGKHNNWKRRRFWQFLRDFLEKPGGFKMFADYNGGKWRNEYEGIENARPLPAKTFDEAVEEAAAAIAECARVLVDHLTPIIKTVADMLPQFVETILEVVFSAYPNPRVVHLAKYGHGRTKKKNIHRILKWYQRGAC